MPRGMVGLLAAVAAAMSAVIGLAHGVLFWAAAVDAAAAAGLAAYLALPPTKKKTRLRYLQILMLRNLHRLGVHGGASERPPRRFYSLDRASSGDGHTAHRPDHLDANYRRVPGRDEPGR
jgi:hypothetical protein